MPSTLTLDITGFDYEARGVARHDGKTHFVSGALPGERVTARVLESKKRYAIAEAIDILIPAPERVPPACPHYAACGGCALQHASDAAQRRLKETVWLEQLARIGGVRPQTVLPAVSGADWHYRPRTRLAWDGVNLGYRARAGNRVVPITHCLTLAPALAARLPDIRTLCATLARTTAILGVDLSAGDDVNVLRIRLRDAVDTLPAQEAVARWNDGAAQPWQIRLQHGADTVAIPPGAPPLAYRLPDYGLTFPYAPDDFTQNNAALNRRLVPLALAALAAPAGARVIDFFCGLGNFSLPLARSGAEVLGIEGVDEMVACATANAAAHGLADRCRFTRADLFAVTAKQLRRWGRADYWLLDPPRAGAQALCTALDAQHGPARIAYVSCNPGTLARDAAILSGKGYRIASGRLLHMFAQTAHVESLLLFTR